ncbi:MAG: glutamate-5-semialdehyde dehydrogenase [Gammaproteobacteria bacterium]|nr:glutamate-5-semialdehyde dehydrogenase [Gammaproteobacteria bacterium]
MKTTSAAHISEQAKFAARTLRTLTTEQKNTVLKAIAERLSSASDQIIEANSKDLNTAKSQNLSAAMIDRLRLNEERIKSMADSLREVADLNDPVGVQRSLGLQQSGIEVLKKRIPIGVILMIYESRPNVTVEAASLAFKSGNAIILKGGKEAANSNRVLADIIQATLVEFGIDKHAVQSISTSDRSVVSTLLKRDEDIDLVIPRGGTTLIDFVNETSRIPVIQHYQGVCHLYVDKSADLAMALDLLINGKTQRVGVCNALEGLVVHQDIADDFLNVAVQHLRHYGVEIFGCDRTSELSAVDKVLKLNDFGQEYLAKKIAIRVVSSLDEAIDHIDQFGSQHTEVICTEDQQRADQFIQSVDAAVTMHNSSSRFSDGGELGLGAEIGIATTKLHAYGPMGLESLTTEKFVVRGSGQVRA